MKTRETRWFPQPYYPDSRCIPSAPSTFPLSVTVDCMPQLEVMPLSTVNHSISHSNMVTRGKDRELPPLLLPDAPKEK